MMLSLRWFRSGLVTVATILPAAGSPHDELQAKSSTHTAPQQYLQSVPNTEGISRELSQGSSATYASCAEVVGGASKGPIRIGFELVETDGVPSDLQNLVKDKLLPRAAAFFAGALQVYQATEPLRAFRVNYGSGFEAPTCGSDGIVIPDAYLMPGVHPYVTDEFATGEGVLDKDFHMFVTIKDGADCSSSDLQAYASWCVKDQCDRPILGLLNFCRSKLSLLPADEDSQYYTTIHELTHAMVFSSSLFPYFRNSDGTPKIPRSSDKPSEIPSAVRWNCNPLPSPGSYIFPDPDAKSSLQYVDLAPDIIGTFTERGFNSSECACPVGNPSMGQGCIVPTSSQFRQPSCVMRLKTPSVIEEARSFFGCSTLEGAELENQDSAACTIIASHWEQRVFNGEVMSPYGTGLTPRYISRVTLALFQDSGWYDVDFSKADTLTRGVHWGYKQGCSFALEKCVDEGSTKYPRHYCTTPKALSCSLDRRYVRQCSDLASLEFTSTGQQFKYFSNNNIAISSKLDYCPVADVRISNRVCTDASSDTYSANVNMMREILGTNSRCLESNLRADVTLGAGVYSAEGVSLLSPVPMCYETECYEGGSKYIVKVAVLDPSTAETLGASIIGICSSSGQSLTRCDFIGSITCAAPDEVCFDRSASTASLPQIDPAAVCIGDSDEGNNTKDVNKAWSPRLGLGMLVSLAAMTRRLP